MDFNITKFPDGVNVTLRYLDSLDWFTNTPIKGILNIPIFGSFKRGFDWWNIDTSETTFLGQKASSAQETIFSWKPGETELNLSLPNITLLDSPWFIFEGIPDNCVVRYKDLDNITEFKRLLGTGSKTYGTLIIEGNSTGLTSFSYFSYGPVKNFYLNLDCSNLKKDVSFTPNNSAVLSALTYFNGFPNLKSSQTSSSYGISKFPNLSYESCISILENLYDFSGNGETPNSNQGKLKVHANFLSLVGDQISIGTNKGWTITT